MRSGNRGTDPTDHMGVYKCLADVPEKHRLQRFQSAFEGRDVWQEWLEATDRRGFTKHERAGRYWREYMADYGRHPALPDPEHVESYFESLYADMKDKTVYNYFYRTRNFFQWLTQRTDYPHRYNPVHMAADNEGKTRQAWNYWIEYTRR